MKRLVILMSCLGLVGLVAGARPASAADFKVVVNASNPVATLSTPAVQRLFLKKDTRWPNGNEVEPCDQSAKAAVRADFSTQVHGKDVTAVRSFWQKQIFSGRATPPPEMSSDAEVLAFVRTNPGAVGYVSAAAATGDGVKVVKLTD